MVTLTNTALGTTTGVLLTLIATPAVGPSVTIGTTVDQVPPEAVANPGTNGAAAIPMVFDFDLAVGSTSTLKINVNPLTVVGISVSEQRATMDIQELPVATG